VFIETDPRTLNRFVDTLNRYIIMEDVALTDVSALYGSISLYGLKAPDHLSDQAVVDSVAAGGWVARREPAALNRYDIWLPLAFIDDLRGQLIVAKVTEINDATCEVLRVEGCDPAWGTELTESTLLPEAEISYIVSYTKGCYVGQEIIARLHSRGHTNWVLRQVRFSAESEAILPGSVIFVEGEDREVARITSAVISPKCDGARLALAYVRTVLTEVGGTLKGNLVDAVGNSRSVDFSVFAIH
jgi:folate-binding protein YgfZ